ncbi:MAG: winged helix-turn-helix domain-containing protein [Blastocatellia bacterium]|nr:winged helix-turn-helix domain-containing protein [Blastocatellia bacterium]
MSQFPKKLYEFGAFRLDAAERVLWHGEEMLVLPPKVFDTLLVLVEKEGLVVSKSELMEAVWADAFVEESNLSQNIYTLRRTLGVDEQGRQYIETVPRRGYRFATPVKVSGEFSNESAKRTEEVALKRVTTNSSVESLENDFASPSFPLSTGDSQAFRAIQTQLAPPSARARPHPALPYALWAGLGVLILSALGFGIYQFILRRAEKGEAKTAPIEQLRFQRLTDSGDVVYPTISPNGELLAYVRLEEQGGSVWVKQIATGSAVQTLPPSRKGYRSLAFSPDGKYLFFREEADPGAIYQTPAFGSALKIVADNVWSDFSVSPDGKQFAFIRRDTGRNAHLLILSNTDGSGERELSARNAPMDYRGSAPAWSPDGAKLVVAGGLQQQSPSRLLTVDVATGQETELNTRSWRGWIRALWTADGKHLYVTARATDEPYSQLWMIAYPDGKSHRLTNDLEGYFWLSLSADGRMLVMRQQKFILHLWLLTDGDLKRARQLTFGERIFDGYAGLAWTPDGEIVFSSFAGRNTDLYSMNPDGSDRVRLTADAGQDNTDPAVSRDGRYIVFTSNRTGTTQIWRMDIDGRNQKQLTFGEERREGAQSAALSPDGKEVFFIKIGAGSAAIWKVSIEGGTPVPVSRLTDASTEGSISISPDGRWLAYRHVSVQAEAGSEGSTVQIGVLPTDGSTRPRLFDLPMRRPIIQWSVDSAAFYYAAGTFKSSSLWRQPLDGGEPQKVAEFPDRIFNFAWSRDGKNLAVSRGRQQGDAILITNLP